MAKQNRLDLGRRNLHPLVFDQLLQTIDDEEAPVGVDVPEIAGVQPPVVLDHVAGCVRPVQVAFHDLRTADADLTRSASARARRR